jgi:hypothetical protein
MEFISLYIPREKSTDEIITTLKDESDSAAILRAPNVRAYLRRLQMTIIWCALAAKLYKRY